MAAQHSVTLNLLRSHYAVVYNLRGYLSRILRNGSQLDLVQDDDNPNYKEFLNCSYVALQQELAVQFGTDSPVSYMRDVIKLAQRDILRRPRSLTSNIIITAGYRLAHRESTGVAVENYAVVNNYVNTIITALQSSEWETLLTRIGEAAMLHLLRDTSIFVPLPNECFCQVTGYRIINLKTFGLTRYSKSLLPSETGTKRKAPELEAADRLAKRAKVGAAASFASVDSHDSASGRKPHKKPPRSPSDIQFSRVRLYYARASFVPHTRSLIVGLPAHHVLHQLNPSYFRKPKVDPEYWVDPDPKEQLNNARHFAKYVFPRQHGLSNPFNMPIDEQNVMYDHGRGSEIKRKGFIKTPKRVKPALKLLEQLIWRHGKCGYKALLNKICPSKMNHEKLNETQILSFMSEHSSSFKLLSQSQQNGGDTSIDSEGVSIVPCGLTQAMEYAESKPRCVDFAISHFEVFRYAIVITEQLIPKTFWGCTKNFEIISKYVKEFIDGRRYETMSLHHVLQNFSTSECDWVCSDNPAAQKYPRVSVSDSLKRRELIEDFLYWYFDSFLLSLLRTTFYATESSVFRNRIIYFRQDDWQTLCEPLLKRLASVTFKEMDPYDAQEILRQRKLGFSFVRLVPKEAGVRPIVNLKRKVARGPSGQQDSINRILKAAFEILTYEKEARPELLGESVFGPDDVYKKLKAFKVHLTSGDLSKKLPKLYFVKVDVQACFDTIDQSKLLEVLRDIISEDNYTIRRYGLVAPNLGKSARKYVRKAGPADEHTDFFPHAVELAAALRHTIFVDQVPYHSSTKQEILSLLEEHITENIVKIGDLFYRQVVGIPQGSILSTLLCSFSYGDLERRKFKFSEDDESVLLRLVDDYLLVTTNISKARDFLQMMREGHPEYGCTISPDKTKTNFDFGSQLSNVTDPHEKSFPWCGYLIDMRDLSVSTDYSRFNKTCYVSFFLDVQDSLTVPTGRQPGLAFTNKMLLLSRHKSHAIFCDTDLNSVRTVYFNIYTNFLLSAMKMQRYVRIWNIDVERSTKLISDTIHQMIRYTYNTVRNKTKNNKVAKSQNAKCEVEEKSVIWLGTHAFHTILSRVSDKYSPMLTKLETELSHPRHSGPRREFGALVQEGLQTFSHIHL